MAKLKIAVVGAGSFSTCFVPLYQAHPLVSEVSLCDMLPDRLRQQADILKVSRTFTDFDEMLKSDVDAVAIFTQRWTHAPLALAALRAGKHVYSAVPAATTLEELNDLIEAVKQTGLTYMMGETSQYYGTSVYCRDRWEAGDFGNFVYGEGEYLHDMSIMYESFRRSGGEEWIKTASYPPMLYPTHSVSMILSVTGARMTSVSCLGYTDRHEDGVFRKEVSLWGNAFSNQTALYRTSDGGMARVNEFRRVGEKSVRSVRLSIYGTLGSFEEQADGAVWTQLATPPESVEAIVNSDPGQFPDPGESGPLLGKLREEFDGGFARAHHKLRERLPESYRGQRNGHEGSHQFLSDDFISAAAGLRPPTVSIWDAARYNAPGIVAHESSKLEGERLAIPDFGTAPA